MPANLRSLRGHSAASNAPVIERPGVSRDEIEELREAFNLFDTENTGAIDPKELKSAMQSLGYDAKNQIVYAILEKLDKQPAAIDFETFLDMMTARLTDKDSKEDILKVFSLFDDDNTGRITLDNLKRVARELGEDMGEEELKEMIQRADLDGTGSVSPDEFINIMTKKTFS